MSSLATPKYLTGKKVLLASGPTCEPIDDVRVITNQSSGKMGAALAQAAWLSGAQVTVVSGPAQAPMPRGVRIINVTTAQEMQAALLSEFPATDVCIMAAAISDFRPKSPAAGKLHRNELSSFSIELVANPDIAQQLGDMKNKQVLVCFSLETNDDDERALAKMHTKKCDMMIVNRVATSLGSDTTQITILYPDKPTEHCSPERKTAAAQRIIERCAACMGTFHE
jgi:phosphopantothenoylcysteine decarboxylase/phosphopantothenate--cysteine ligase